jgi:DNA-binding SARP family transcriptional activator
LQIDEGARLAVRVLGPIEVHFGRRPVDIGGARPKALVALLAIDRNLTVAGDRLADALWPGHDSECADIDLRSAVSRLRKRLRMAGADHPLIVTRPAGYALELEPDQLDAAQFEQWVAEARESYSAGHYEEAAGGLRMALALWRGRAFGEAADEPFARTEVRRLEELRLAAIELRVDAELALGRHGELVAELEALSGEHPEREELWGRRMLALYRCGRQAEALRVYQALRRNLIEQLGIEPGPDVARLEQQILSQHPELAWRDTREARSPALPASGDGAPGDGPGASSGSEVASEPTAAGTVGGADHDGTDVAPGGDEAAAGGVMAPGGDDVPTGGAMAPSGEVLDEAADVFPLVGRRGELAVLSRWWTAVTTGNGVPLLALSGEMGVGKTRLARALARQAAADGALVLWSRCDEEPIEPYQPFAELLRHYVAGLSPAELDRIPLWQTAELSHLVPGLRGRVEERLRAKSGGGDGDGERLRFVQAITSTLTELSKTRHVLLVLDDLHHADHPTLLLLRHLLRNRHRGGPVVLATYRPTDMPPGHPLRAAFGRLTGDAEPMQLAIGGLDEAGVEELLAAAGVAVRPDVPGLLYLTRGNPLLLCEIIAQLTDGPGTDAPVVAGGVLELPVPATISELLASRLAGLPTDVITLVEAAAVAGPQFDAHVAGEAAGLDPSQALDAFDRAVAVGLLREEVGAEGHYAFTHPLFREAIYRSLSRGRRVRLHHRTAEAISTLGPTLRDRHLDDLARHAALGVALGDPVDVVRSCLVAGRHALRQRSPLAIGHFVRALGILDRYGGEPVIRCDVLLGLAEARLGSGEHRLATDAASEAAQIARRLEDTARLARAAQCGAQEGLGATTAGPSGRPGMAGYPTAPSPAPAVRAATTAGD